MADIRTSQCPKSVSDRPLQAATSSTGPIKVGVDIFALPASPPEWGPGWLNPAWHLIPQVLKLAVNCPGAAALLVVPTMGSKHWWPQFLRAARGRKWTVPQHRAAYANLEGQEVPGRHSLTCGLTYGTASLCEFLLCLEA